jgi:hypothetical protein
MADTSRMSREVHVRICGGLEVKFLRSTRLYNLRTTGAIQHLVDLCANFFCPASNFPPVSRPIMGKIKLPCDIIYMFSFSLSPRQLLYIQCLY